MKDGFKEMMVKHRELNAEKANGIKPLLSEVDAEIETEECPQYTIKIELKVGKETHIEEINPFLKMYMSGLNIVVYNGAYDYQFPHEQVSKITIEAME